MTTAARPTWAPAKGGNEQGGARIFGASQKYSSRDVAAHTTLKPRFFSSLLNRHRFFRNLGLIAIERFRIVFRWIAYASVEEI